jgi:hypothetical protein
MAPDGGELNADVTQAESRAVSSETKLTSMLMKGNKAVTPKNKTCEVL